MRININYILDSETQKRCLKTNKIFCEKFADSGIDFSKGCRPHMTLLMGEIDEKDYDFVIETVKNMQFSAVGRSFEVTKPYTKNAYIFVDAVDAEPFILDCDSILKQLGDKIQPHRFLISNGTSSPHISLGFSKNASLDAFANSIEPLSAVDLVGVTVSKTGKNGTCLVEKEEDKQCEKK